MRRVHLSGGLAATLALIALYSPTQTHAGFVINATFDSSITGLPGAAAIEGAINSAIGVLEADISTNITVAVDFKNMSSGLGSSSSFVYTVSYYAYYNALAAVATTPAQLAAIASLGTPPTPGSGNPVTSDPNMTITGPLGRALGFNTSPGVGQYDTVISLNTSITSPPNSLSGNYGLQAVAAHELDETLGIGGTGSELSNSTAVGPLDLYRYSAPGIRSYSTSAVSAYFSIDRGTTSLTGFNQAGGGTDYGDWAGGPQPQVQDAFGTPGSNPALGVNELTALNVVGYSLTSNALAVPEPSTVVMLATALVCVSSYGWSSRKPSSRAPKL